MESKMSQDASLFHAANKTTLCCYFLLFHRIHKMKWEKMHESKDTEKHDKVLDKGWEVVQKECSSKTNTAHSTLKGLN